MTKRSKRDSYHVQGRYVLTPKMCDVVKKRTDYLMHYSMISTRPITDLITMAYVQGMLDGKEAFA